MTTHSNPRNLLRGLFIRALIAAPLLFVGDLACGQSGSRGVPAQPAPSFQAQPAPSFRAAPQPAPSFRSAPQAAPQRSFSQPLRTQPAPTERRFEAQRNTLPPQRTIGRASFDQIDHRSWDRLVNDYVDARGNVDYQAWQSNPSDRQAMRDYLTQLMQVDSRAASSRVSQMAFWINAYNALTIEGILQLYPIKSIKDFAPSKDGYNIWDDFKLNVDGGSFSLNDIEHKVLRPLKDPRIHFAIVCASRGCPQLINRAYFPQTLDQQLNENAQRFFADQEKFRYDTSRGLIEVSPILEWFGEDFGATESERLRSIAQFLPSRDAATLAASGRARVSYLDYDWSLNYAPVRSQSVDAVQNLRRPSGTFEDLYQDTAGSPPLSGNNLASRPCNQ